MINIKDIEEGILIEAGDFNYSVINVVSDVKSQSSDMSNEEVLKTACNIIASLVLEGYIKIVKTKYKEEEEGVYSPISTDPLDNETLDLFMKNPDKWEEMGVHLSLPI